MRGRGQDFSPGHHGGAGEGMRGSAIGAPAHTQPGGSGSRRPTGVALFQTSTNILNKIFPKRIYTSVTCKRAKVVYKELFRPCWRIIFKQNFQVSQCMWYYLQILLLKIIQNFRKFVSLVSVRVVHLVGSTFKP